MRRLCMWAFYCKWDHKGWINWYHRGRWLCLGEGDPEVIFEITVCLWIYHWTKWSILKILWKLQKILQMPFHACQVWLKVVLEQQWNESLQSERERKGEKGSSYKGFHLSYVPCILPNPHICRLYDVQF